MFWMALLWVIFFCLFALGHLRVRAAGGVRSERRVHRDRSSDWGMVLQFAAIVLAFTIPGPERRQFLFEAVCLSVVSMWLAFAALLHLGRQWRVRAVITDDHQLVTTGPYRLMRHPIYLAMLGMLLATVLERSTWWGAVLSLAVFVLGTEVRVRAEDRLLERAFGAEFRAFAASVPAYLPGLR